MKKLESILFLLLILLLSIYSWALIDPNLTLLSHPLWTSFRNSMVNLGYYNRPISSLIFTILIFSLFFLSYHLENKKLDATKLAVIIACLSFLGYPFLSHDYFNYLFDAKILTFYKKNPYNFAALDFPEDPWIRFMHWTHRKYPYGPLFLIISAIPSYLSFGKFFLNFFLGKLPFIISYLASVYFLNKISRRVALFFALSPLVIVEGLINLHNDLIAVGLGIAGVYFLIRERKLLSSLFLISSILIKYLSFPILVLITKIKKKEMLSFLLFVVLMIWIYFKKEIQPWYFLNLFILLPFVYKWIEKLRIFFLGLLLSYYPYLRFSGWADEQNIKIKHWIILGFLVLNLFVIIIRYSYPKKK